MYPRVDLFAGKKEWAAYTHYTLTTLTEDNDITVTRAPEI